MKKTYCCTRFRKRWKPIQIVLSLLVLIFLNFNNPVSAQITEEGSELDVLSYHLELQPDLYTKSIEGNVQITFLTSPKTKKVIFNCGNLHIQEVKGATLKSFQQQGDELMLTLSDQATTENIVQISYTGTPKKGLQFLSDPPEMYTVYFTSEWMVCHDTPDDKACIKIDLLVPKGFTALASGELQRKIEKKEGKVLYSFNQNYGTPAYTYGFSIGSFQESHESHGEVSLDYYSQGHSPAQLASIFDKTGDMMSFLEEKSGIKYGQNSYAQILIGNHYQEMSGLSVLKKSYGALVLADSTETNLISHELAHQWWGNRITCESWTHFWLNEGFATFLSAAYNEHRFGKKKYQADIDSYYQVYAKIKEKGADKSLVFTSWAHPSRDDRNLVYFKGAYVLHLLREELGDEVFWKGIKHYSQTYFGKSVNTQNFQDALEESSHLNLQSFFDEWIY